MSQHDMGPSTLNHGVSQCRKCKATDREIAYALGPVCPVEDPKPSYNMDEFKDYVMMTQASWFMNYFQRVRNASNS